MKEKVVLAYSGGLDTTAIIPWLKENFDYEVSCVCVNCGQAEELDGLEEKAKATGASKLYVLDLKKDFVENYIFPTLKFGAKYEDYLLGTSFARPCIAKALADIAIKEGADAICHSPPLFCTAGCTDHLHAVFAKALGNGPADATACAGDDGHFAFDTVKIHHFHSPFSQIMLLCFSHSTSSWMVSR